MGVSVVQPEAIPNIRTDNVKNSFKENVFLTTTANFKSLALEIFFYQAKYNPVYSKFLELINIRPETITELSDIPYLPIDFYKQHVVSCRPVNEKSHVFLSSSTTGQGQSKHYINDISQYETAFTNSFEFQFGKISEFTFRFLLPSYLEREGSSLVYMAEKLLGISESGGFYLKNFKQLSIDLSNDINQGRKTILLGVSFALIDFANQYPMDLSSIIVMDTGGMKGRREEITRQELHSYLTNKFKSSQIASEYGMTELLSQAYSLKDGLFVCPPWMKISIGQTTDPFELEKLKKTGTLKIIDLSNYESCSFIQTSDLGRVFEDGTFEILGRYDNSDTRGCNLMAVD